MPIKEQCVTEQYALFNADCVETMKMLPEHSVHFSAFSLPFAGLYQYSSDPRDLSNCTSYEQFLDHYAYVAEELARLTIPGRMAAVHCIDIPSGNSGLDHLVDFPGDLIRLHARFGWQYIARYHVWKEPLGVRNRTMTKGLAHQTVVEDASRCSNAGADYVLIFRNKGTTPIPIAHPTGLDYYAGERQPPLDVRGYRNWTGKQTENRYSHWIWRQYASAFWDDVRINRVLPYKEASEEDERHIHPLQLDVIERLIVLWSNPGETILSPFAGVGSEVYSAVALGRKGIGIELKTSYYRQMLKNLAHVTQHVPEQEDLFASLAAPSLTQD